MGRIGLTELLILLVIALVVFGGGKIADVGKGIGDAVKNFKKGMKEDDEADAPKLNESAAKPAEAPAPPVITVVDEKTAAEATNAEPAADATKAAPAAEEPPKAAPGEEKPAA
jgi:sec-independent protein translocase protein TatA